MIKKIRREVEVEEMSSVICDKCKKEFSGEDAWEEIQEFLHVDFVGGYGSIFGDGLRVQCDICQHCLKKMIEKYIRTEVVH